MKDLGKSPSWSVQLVEDYTGKRDNPNALEYQGEYISPKTVSKGQNGKMARWQGEAMSRYPIQSNVPSHDRLRREIALFSFDIQPDETETVGRKLVIEDVLEVATGTLPENSLAVFGSEKTGLTTAVSDLDFRLCPSADEILPDQDPKMAPRYATRDKMLRSLRKLHSAFVQDPRFMLVVFRYSRYPLINMTHKRSGIDIQIVCSNDTSLQRELMNAYLAEYPALKNVFHLVKTMFSIRGLTDVFRGGLGSYSIFMMIVAALELNKKSGGAVLNSNETSLFIHFLSFWSQFDTYAHGITISPPSVFEKLGTAKPNDQSKVDDVWIPSQMTVDESFSETLNMTSDGPEPEILVHLNLAKAATKPVPSESPVLVHTEDAVQEDTLAIGATKPTEPYLLSLIDPADDTNDLGRKGNAIKHIIATIQRIYLLLQMRMFDYDFFRILGERAHLLESSTQLRARMERGQINLDEVRQWTTSTAKLSRDEDGKPLPKDYLKWINTPFLRPVVGASDVYKSRRDMLREWVAEVAKSDERIARMIDKENQLGRHELRKSGRLAGFDTPGGRQKGTEPMSGPKKAASQGTGIIRKHFITV
ncbi:hypothetical protein NA57DRAFT_54136 [Rhizodiscina lignyota]|uniref:Poly(A) RNA polymerase mitochondrial-like central palm domain-containing protein n=1 Tax=Rhizodiscina lignyota TaxID=1504668 RepID=A0A9P4IMM9_9PEZI|nr:hypothetical protein NA57DRAFT_54136 [Rhizodiscina lignyota]